MEQPQQEPDTDIARTLSLDGASRKRKHLKWWIVIGVLGVLTGTAGVVMNGQSRSPDSSEFQTVKVRRESFSVDIIATGTLKPINQVDVGSELSGTIDSVKVDYNDRVRQGQILATLNTDELEAKVLESKSSLESEQARLRVARATLVEASLKFQRVQQLIAKRLVPLQDVDVARAAYDRARAEEASAKARVTLAQANLDANRTNLAKAAIRSPIDGIVLARKVEPGQTVAASFQTPVLFTLAEDLTRMVLHANVDEANMGQIKEGQDASFTVDAYPSRKFPAKIVSIRNDPQTVDGIVTYETLLSVDNSELLLRPGMTATANITAHRVAEAIVVPNGALRFSKSRSGEAAFQGAAASPDRSQVVWTLRDGKPVAIPVSVGQSDGHVTEIIAGELNPGMSLLVNEIDANGGGNQATRLSRQDN
ncbi:efflux RND transporter periplasmic adaptor subunit [Methylocaldum marinum]|nr:efflux RND transporter periplasmic adaptor subunit [Methylocaldum marinum]